MNPFTIVIAELLSILPITIDKILQFEKLFFK